MRRLLAASFWCSVAFTRNPSGSGFWEISDTPLNPGKSKGFRVLPHFSEAGAGDFACLRFSQDDHWLAFGWNGDTKAILWEVASGQECRVPHGPSVSALPGNGFLSFATSPAVMDFSPDGRLIASIAGDGVRILDRATKFLGRIVGYGDLCHWRYGNGVLGSWQCIRASNGPSGEWSCATQR